MDKIEKVLYMRNEEQGDCSTAVDVMEVMTRGENKAAQLETLPFVEMSDSNTQSTVGQISIQSDQVSVFQHRVEELEVYNAINSIIVENHNPHHDCCSPGCYFKATELASYVCPVAKRKCTLLLMYILLCLE